MFSVLLVDDDSIDTETLQRAFRRHPEMVKARLTTVKDGKAALEFLAAQSEHPSLVLLDINMPGMGGIDFLEKVRSTKELECLRVLVLTTSADNNDVQQAYSKCVIGYVTKDKAGNCTELTELIYHYCNLTVK